MTKVVFNEATGAFEDADNTPDPHPAPASQQTDVLFHASLIDREWGASLLSVAKLLTWVQSQGLELVTMPDLEGFRFVQPEALLSAIQRATASQTDPRTAAAVIEATPALAGSRPA